MNRNLEKILYFPLYILLWLLALLPFWALYILSDIFFVLVYYVAKYRRKVVYENMRNSFPDKSEKDIHKMERAFYRHFCDYALETIKLLHISDATTKQHFVMENTEVLQKAIDENRQVILMLGHYGNWEYVLSVSLWLNAPENAVIGGLYRPLKNKWFDDLFLKLRSRYKNINIPKNDVLREFIKLRRDNRPTIIGFLADQTPSPANIHYWSKFLNQDTPMLTGIERIAQKFNATLIYADIIKEKRGHYRVVYSEVTQTPKEYKEFEITEIYTRLMEKTILRAPEYWLWTHKRWKHKR